MDHTCIYLTDETANSKGYQTLTALAAGQPPNVSLPRGLLAVEEMVEAGCCGFCGALYRHYMNRAKFSFVLLMLKKTQNRLFSEKLKYS